LSDEETGMPNRIIVLGVLRSGTSLTAELVHRWGAYAGRERDLVKTDVDDPRGYYYMEYLALQEFNDELLDNNDRLPRPTELLIERLKDPAYLERAMKLIQAMDEEAKENQAIAWVWKDARLPLLLPFWTNVWGDVTYVVTVRHPAESALSSAKTEDFSAENLPFSASFAYWQYCMLQVLSFTQSSQRKIFVAYDQLIQKPRQECTRLCHFLDAQFGQAQATAEQRVEAMVPQIVEGQRHHRYHNALAEMEQATREQRALYDFLRVKTIYPDEAFSQDDFALYPGWLEYLQCMDMLLTLTKIQEQQG
jgi:hypothetical protein